MYKSIVPCIHAYHEAVVTCVLIFSSAKTARDDEFQCPTTIAIVCSESASTFHKEFVIMTSGSRPIP